MLIIADILFSFKITAYKNLEPVMYADWSEISTKLLEKFETFDKEKIKFPYLGFGFLCGIKLYKTNGIIVTMSFDDVKDIPTNINLNPKVKKYLPELFEPIFLSRNTIPTFSSKCYFIIIEFTDMYLINYKII